MLVLAWYPCGGQISFDLKELWKSVKNRNASKRLILRVLGHILNPIDFFVPFVIKSNYNIQKLWGHDLDRDERLSSSLDHKWQLLSREVEHLTNIRIPDIIFQT
ncbi:hypothetical protein NPIL_472111 [Nephila pilipes]|uniref:Uncharacterized protein n=1 Tax=Nephila pilipes TaxID=299642 RepID=A0A8X6N2U4_NEPPI|nr:hypothetical protein NPIL_472111 [Nephila pilipes]